MVFLEKNLARQAVSSAGETVYTTPTYKTIVVKDINITNNGTGDCYINIWLVPSSSSRSNDNILISKMIVPENSLRHWSGYQVLSAGDTIQAQSEINDQITLTISGAEIS